MPSATSAIALGADAQPLIQKQAAGALVESGSKEALNRLTAAVAELKVLAIAPLL